MSRTWKKGPICVVLLGVGFLMTYLLIQLSFATFKTSQEPFGRLSPWPEKSSLDGIINGWKGSGQFTYTTFYENTLLMAIPTVIFTVLPTGIATCGSARFSLPCKKVLFLLMTSMLMLLDLVIIIPRYVLLRKFGWADTYMPFWMPGLLACYLFFIFMRVQFLKGIPRGLNGSTCMDGCNSFMTYVKTSFPLMKPMVFSVIIFQFLWRWNDYFSNLIYVSSVKKYALSLVLKMFVDGTGAVTRWNQVLSMSFLSIISPTLLYFFAQDYFVKGITAGGAKG